MKQYEEIYLELLKEFLNDVKDYKDKVDMSGLFLPHTLSKYSSAKTKYFYCGQDTYEWTNFSKMIKYYENNDITGYLDENNSWPSVDEIIEYSNNKEGNFWTLIIRLHIYLHRKKIINVNTITERDKVLLEEIGWGNINSIEIPKTLQNRELWESLDKDCYWDIKEKSRAFDSIKHIMDLYNPDYIFIFNWAESKEEDVFKGLRPNWNKDEYIEGIISTYCFDDYKTKLIWCLHPNSLRYKSMNINELIEEIDKRV